MEKIFVQSTKCVLCDNSDRETMMHLFFSCSFSQITWEIIGEEWKTDLGLMDMLIEAKNRSTNPFFELSMIVGCWSIWNHKNKIIFGVEITNIDTCVNFFKTSVVLIRHRAKPILKEGMQIWTDHM